jgi:hypothetical protein
MWKVTKININGSILNNIRFFIRSAAIASCLARRVSERSLLNVHTFSLSLSYPDLTLARCRREARRDSFNDVVVCSLK